MGKISYALKKHPLTAKQFAFLKKQKDKLHRRQSSSGRHVFIDRSQGSDDLCIVLAGYKEQCYPATLGRLAQEAPKDMDVCIVSSGLFSPTLERLCEEHGWSYLSTQRNNVCLVQNMAIELHPHAQHIYKLDEDIFICRDYFTRLKAAYQLALQSPYRPGVVAPAINLNGFSSYHILDRLDLLADFALRFEPLKSETGRDHPVELLPDVARYLWGEGGHVPSIDEIDELLNGDEPRVLACPHVFSIGAILFDRGLWEDIGFFPVGRSGNSLGKDEQSICTYCFKKSRPLMVSMNLAVGHLSFKTQNETMMRYYSEHEEVFLPHPHVESR